MRRKEPQETNDMMSPIILDQTLQTKSGFITLSSSPSKVEPSKEPKKMEVDKQEGQASNNKDEEQEKGKEEILTSLVDPFQEPATKAF